MLALSRLRSSRCNGQYIFSFMVAKLAVGFEIYPIMHQKIHSTFFLSLYHRSSISSRDLIQAHISQENPTLAFSTLFHIHARVE